MNHELIKQLKDNKFPFLKCKCGHDAFEHNVFPSLSKLIEECGDDFMTFAKIHPENKFWEGKKYFAVAYDENSKLADRPSAISSKIHAEGETAEEAVANLWLLLKGQKLGK